MLTGMRMVRSGLFLAGFARRTASLSPWHQCLHYSKEAANGNSKKTLRRGNSRKNPQPTYTERIFNERRVTSIQQLKHTPEERVSKLISTRTAHKILPLSSQDDTAKTVRLIARSILLQARQRASLGSVEKNGIPVLQPVNGIGRFTLPLQRIVFTYCSHAGDSHGMRDFLSSHLKKLAETDPGVEFVVEPRWGRFPLMAAFYIGGREKTVCVKSLAVETIMERYRDLRNSSGAKLVRFRQHVESKAPAVRPLWSPFHMLQDDRKNNPLIYYNRQD